MKFFFTNKLFNISLLAFVGVLAGPLAQGDTANRAELRASFRQDVLRMINRDRISYGLPPVAIDPSASEIGDRYCELQIKNKTTGHFTTDGLPPYMRYSFAGGNGGVSENAAAWSANYKFVDSSILDMIRRSHQAMMLETPPHDGHRRTLLDADATHVGIGLAWHKGEFRMVHEFTRHYVDWRRPAARAASLADRVNIEGIPIPGFRVAAASVYYEEYPQELSPFVANRIETYRLPKTRRDYQVEDAVVSSRRRKRLAEAVDAKSGGLRVHPDGSFAFNAPFTNGEGVYTVVVWVTRDGENRPISASNMSIRVTGNGAGSMRLLGTE